MGPRRVEEKGIKVKGVLTVTSPKGRPSQKRMGTFPVRREAEASGPRRSEKSPIRWLTTWLNEKALEPGDE